MNKFLGRHISSAILQTQFELRGSVHPMGFRMEGISAKDLSYLPYNLIAFAAGAGRQNRKGESLKITINPEIMFDYFDEDLTYEKVLFVCKKFSSECGTVHTEAIRFLLKDILAKTEELKKEAESKGGSNGYVRPLNQESNWGKIFLALMESFKVEVDKDVVIETW